MHTFSPSQTEPTRLDIVLAALLGVSRVQAQKRIAAGDVFVNDIPASSAHVLVSHQDILHVSQEAPPSSEKLPLPPLSILHEDADVLVVEKPAGVLVHPTGAQDASEPTLMDAVVAHFPPLFGVGGDPLRSGVVHRLDREASGVLVFAKHEHAHAFLKHQFKTRQTEKLYDVLVLGRVADEHGTITFPIARSAQRGRMAARPLSQEGKEAITHFDVVQRYSSSTLLRVRIETGRTHQIRAHFFALGHSVAGDKLYVQRNLKQMPLGRLFLHAASLALTLPTGERATFTSPLPAQLQNVLIALKPLPSRI